MSSPFASELTQQWQNPADILSILLIVGADVIKTALAQFTSQSFKLVAFSFGWVAYAYTFLLNTAGRLKSTPDADARAILVDCNAQRVVENSSWIIGRILHNYDRWKPKSVEYLVPFEPRLNHPFDHSLAESYGLHVAVFAPSDSQRQRQCQGKHAADAVFWSGVLVTVIQLGIAAVPCGLYLQWEILLLTACGTGLGWLMGALQERVGFARKECYVTYALTKGNGYRDVVVVLGNGKGLHLGDLASELTAPGNYKVNLGFAIVMVILWTALLITTSGMKSNTWYLIAIGGIGMLQNIYVASASRRPEAYGVHVEYKGSVVQAKVMQTLMRVEEQFPKVGRSLLPIFFPGGLRQTEIEWWDQHS